MSLTVHNFGASRKGLSSLAIATDTSAAPLLNGFENLTAAAEVAGDFLAACMGVLASYGLYHELGLGRQVQYSPTVVVAVAALFGCFFVVTLHREGAYREGHSLLRVKETERALRVSVETFLLVLPLALFAAHLISRWVLSFALIFVPLTVIAEKQLFLMWMRSRHARGRGVRRVLIYGAGLTGKRMFSALVRSPKLGLQPVAFVDDAPEMVGEEIFASDYRRETSAPVISGPVTAQIIRRYRASMVFMAIPTLSREKFSAAMSAAGQAKAKVAYVPKVVSSDSWIEYADLDGLLVATFGAPPPKSFYEIAKRTFDLLVASAIVLASLPVLLAIALAVKLDSPGPVIFKQKRIGRGGVPFNIYKFRSMSVDAPVYGFSPKESHDPRITAVGRFLRRTSLDELPQLLNVIRGDMSLVGPRPEMPFIVERYGERERQRLSVTPGITGLWQLSADRAFLIHENLQYDLYYIRTRGFFMDLAILLHTVVFAMRGV